MCVSRSSVFKVEDFGFVVGERVAEMIGRIYGTRGMYVVVCRDIWIKERIRER